MGDAVAGPAAPAREFVVEADGGSRGNPGPAGYGAVVLDAVTGETLVEAADHLGVATNNVAEYRGLLAGLRAARELDPDATVRVRMDSKLVVEQMSGRWKIKHPDMKPLAAEAARVFPPGRVTYEWMPRASNKHADRLANEAMDAGARGERWSPSGSTAELDAGDARAAAAGEVPVVAEAPAVDAAPGAGTLAASTAAMSDAAADAAADTSVPDTSVPDTSVPDTAVSVAAATADVRAAKTVASPGWGPPDMGAPATFVLLRHGETPLTPQKRFSGSGGSDPSLSAVGREQAEKVAASLARRGTVQAVVASPLARTRETAGIVAARLGLEVTVEEGLRETDFGAWEGLTFGEVRERYPDDLNAWLASPDAEPTGGGESFAATGARVAATRDKLVAAYAGRTVLLVSHVTPIKTFVRLALGAPPESLFRMELSAASLSAVAYYADGGASVRLFNDTSHLR
ncbi:putative bifunctional protein (Ribonuclease H/phosphoglycerate mutase) [Streptomyces ambofaciens ATCC 23877]|uniref:Putative bifunctional protein (Ribonuclease H/phosphoglycerate mutase) n=1 Tax=Streptomyces ambofaciens (strain ATCC 23877 / 3486 / DSM 40053 / JCM 4204 / NBRC 12836 / NRRL B-2516) TaxID=278992 RepID=A0A0K2AQZ9_STRA7|nr:putative bifunctional protein (Ribonuclease H/phosphoglycerate mutase) [Streptomyces ambofaciens ATCC 23877]